MASQIKVTACAHTGITVRHLPRAIYIFHTLLSLPLLRTFRLSPPISTVVGSPIAEMDIAIVELPGGHQIELLQYLNPVQDPSQNSKPLPWQLGSWHLCLVVHSIDETTAALIGAEFEGQSLGWRMLAEQQVLTTGPHAGRKVCYLQDDDGLTFELFENAK